MDMFTSVDFWAAVGQIILIDILLGGDNAVVIALACRSLPPAQRTRGILWGTAGAIVLRVLLIFFALTLLAIPFIKLVGGALLLWIGAKLLLPDHGDGHGNIAASDKLWGAVKTVIVADFVMSLDNVLAIAGAAEGAGHGNTMPLVVFGLLVSIPIIVWGSQLVVKLMDRYPVIIAVGGMLLGWIAGTMAVSDPALAAWVPTLPADGPGSPDVVPRVHYAAGVAGALLVFAAGRWLAARAAAARAPMPQVEGVVAAGPTLIKRVAVAVDGSPGAEKALRRALALRDDVRCGTDLEVHLVNVQRPLPSDVTRFIAGRTVEDYQRERGELALAPARAVAAAAGARVHEHRHVGEPGAVLSEAARALGCDLIVMGARGLGSHTAALIGSVTQGTIAHANVPVLVVK
ncbi:MAG: YjbE family putative metal transport protein [Burkholderiales bacterium]|nr:YjbE family putative metal transport protein [Burkholderiales bacterium]